MRFKEFRESIHYKTYRMVNSRREAMREMLKHYDRSLTKYLIRDFTGWLPIDQDNMVRFYCRALNSLFYMDAVGKYLLNLISLEEFDRVRSKYLAFDMKFWDNHEFAWLPKPCLPVYENQCKGEFYIWGKNFLGGGFLSLTEDGKKLWSSYKQLFTQEELDKVLPRIGNEWTYVVRRISDDKIVYTHK